MTSIKVFRRVTGAALLAVLSLLLLLGPLATTVLAGQEKTAVCHLDDDGNYIPITIADPALPTHLAHGDLVVGEDVDENCQPLVADADGDGLADAEDNCVNVANPGQEDRYGSAAGDACEDLDGDGTPDVDEADFCLSIDGVLLESRGTAVCDSTATTGIGANVAVANGDGAEAYAGMDNLGNPLPGANNNATAVGNEAFAVAINGNDNSATAMGVGAVVVTGNGDNNTATATGNGAFAGTINGNNGSAMASGDGAFAEATNGDNNSATAVGSNASADAGGNNNTATASGNGSNADAGGNNSSATAIGDGAAALTGTGDNNSATATGDGARAQAYDGDNNIATAEGNGAQALAIEGNGNDAYSTGVYTCAGAGDDGETAVNEDLCTN